MMTRVRVVLADDHPMYRYGVAAVLESARILSKRVANAAHTCDHQHRQTQQSTQPIPLHLALPPF